MKGAHEAPATAAAQTRRRLLWLSETPSPWALAVPVVAVLAGLLLTASSQLAGGTNLRSTATDVPDLIRRESQRTSLKQEQVTNLREQITELSNSGNGAQVRRAKQVASRLGPVAGAQPVKGNTVTVTLDDSEMSADNLPEGITVDDIVVHQQDVQAFVNALWRGGAEAMMIMDQRIISTSAVRCVGNTLILQGRVYSPPFVITAVGDPAAMRASLDEDHQVGIYKEYVSAVGLGLTVEDTGERTLPAYEGSMTLKYAKVMTGNANGPSSAGK